MKSLRDYLTTDEERAEFDKMTEDAKQYFKDHPDKADYTINQFITLFNDESCNQLWCYYVLEDDYDWVIFRRTEDNPHPDEYKAITLPGPEGEYYELDELVDMFNRDELHSIYIEHKSDSPLWSKVEMDMDEYSKTGKTKLVYKK